MCGLNSTLVYDLQSTDEPYGFITAIAEHAEMTSST